MLLTARQLKEECGEIPLIYRAGVWKARTSPRTFRGAGDEALSWLVEVRETLGIPVATEVATPEHVVAALNAKIDYLWIGARTSANPIAVQELADTLSMQHFYPQGVFIKNPMHEDSKLWLGNIERFELAGVPVAAIHRGCNHKPCWAMAHAVRLARPDIPLLIDPSHMSGKAEQVPVLLQKAGLLHYNGAMVEVHADPSHALSDAKQQITPAALANYLHSILSRFCLVSLNCPPDGQEELNWLRAEIDDLDEQLWDTIAQRMKVSKRIGKWKKQHGIPPLQPLRYQEILEQRQQWATKNGLSKSFVEQLWNTIHAQSLHMQE